MIASIGDRTTAVALRFSFVPCATPGRLIHPGEMLPMEILRFLGEQLDIDPAAISDYATRARI